MMMFFWVLIVVICCYLQPLIGQSDGAWSGNCFLIRVHMSNTLTHPSPHQESIIM
jgi:uncharacterized oligopeptide transporter (OPT) family protein